MGTLSRWAGYLAIVGGGLLAIVVVITSLDPNSVAWVGFFVVPILLGLAVLGFEARTRSSTGQLGRWSAWLSAAGVVGVVVVFIWSAISGEGTTAGYSVSTDPLIVFWILTGGAWILGNLGYAVALVRAKALSVMGSWLVLAGALVGLVVVVALGQNLPPIAFVVFAVFGIGWAVIGYAAVRPRVLATA